MKGRAKSERSSRALSLWIVPSGDGKVRKLRLSYLSLFLLACAAGAITVTLVLLAGDYTRTHWQRLRGYMLMRQLEAERDALVSRENELHQEIENLRLLQAQSLDYERDVRQKLSELSQVLQRATDIDLAEDAGSEQAAPLEGGIGGAELDCTAPGAALERCPAAGILLNRAIVPVMPGEQVALLSGLGGESQPAAEGLISLLDRYVEFFEALPLGKPSSGGKISSGFGFRYSPFTRHLSLHEGIDISVGHGSEISATADGVVINIENNPTYGLMVDVQHNERLVTRYAHLSKIAVSYLESVKAGSLIGYSGSTGRSTGPHLHYEVHVDGEPKNPKKFINLSGTLKQLL
ncbi:MAG: M23 family metallopeptidase [Deltaproteobacteria bacterium]|nr:M23 family metallopeptidase [Deltaproteobacteria bacterium]